MLRKHKLYFIFLMISIAAILSGCVSENERSSPKVIDVQLDLTRWELSGHEPIQLDGKWEFYWNRFLNVSELQTEKADLLVPVPDSWDNYEFGGQKLPGEGSATYRLHVKTGLPANTALGIRVYTISSAYRFYINDKLVASNGRISSTAAEEIGMFKPQAVYFSTPSDEFDIIFQVSNHHYARGGLWNPVYIGSPDSIAALNDRVISEETLLLGALLIVALFYLAAFLLMRELRYSLYFALLSLLMGIVYDMSGQFLLSKWFPWISFDLLILIWYSSTNWLLYVTFLYVNELFQTRFPKKIVNAVTIAAILLQLFYLLTPTVQYTGIGRISNFTDLAGFLCIVVIAAIGVKIDRVGGWLNLASLAAVAVAWLHDVLRWADLLEDRSGELMYLGLFIFLLIQMIIQAKRIQQYYLQKNTAELNFLQAQIKPHFLHNGLNTIISISRYDIEKSRDLLVEFSNYLRGSFDIKDSASVTSLKKEVDLVKSYVEIEKARFEERLEVNFELPDTLDDSVPVLVLQPIVENAIIHGVLPKPEGGKVEITVKRDDGSLEFSVKDNGIGMQADDMPVLAERAGNGVALPNINSRLIKKFGSGIHITSQKGVGTEVTWCIPVSRRREKHD